MRQKVEVVRGVCVDCGRNTLDDTTCCLRCQVEEMDVPTYYPDSLRHARREIAIGAVWTPTHRRRLLPEDWKF